MNTIQNGITKVYKIYSHTIINVRNIIYTSLDIYKGCQIHISRYTHKTPEQISRDKGEKQKKNEKYKYSKPRYGIFNKPVYIVHNCLFGFRFSGTYVHITMSIWLLNLRASKTATGSSLLELINLIIAYSMLYRVTEYYTVYTTTYKRDIFNFIPSTADICIFSFRAVTTMRQPRPILRFWIDHSGSRNQVENSAVSMPELLPESIPEPISEA